MLVPRLRGWESGTIPFPALLGTMPAPISSASLATPVPRLSTAPPPSRIAGRSERHRACAAASIDAGSGEAGRAGVRTFQSPVAGMERTSIGTEMCTGRGRDEEKIENACPTSSGTSSGQSAVALNAVTGLVSASWSGISCRQPHPFPRVRVAFVLEITSIGMESAKAWPMGVEAFVTPGPVIKVHTPGLPLARA